MFLIPPKARLSASARKKTGGGGGPTDPDFANVSLLLHMDGSNGSTTFTDSSSNALTVTASGGAVVSTASPQYGTGALATTRSGGILSLPASTALELTGDFTIELWLHLVQDKGRLFGVSGSNARIEINQNTAPDGANARKLYMYNGGQELFDNLDIGLTLGTYRHVAITRSGTSLRAFGGGTLYQTVTHSATVTLTAISGVTGFDHLDAFIDDVRITKGVARYTANFTPPTAAFPDS
jgi:hypothetical protein